MALNSKSLFLYGFEITDENSTVDFKLTGNNLRQATLRLGFYSLSSLLDEMIFQMGLLETAALFSYSVDRSIFGGTQNRVTISCTQSFELLFSSGPRAASSVCSTIGFLAIDKTGATSYVGQSSAGTSLISEQIGYNYISPDYNQEVMGSASISASGLKESIVFQTQEFAEVEFKHIPKANILQWKDFFRWAILQKRFEFTPEVNSPNDTFECTLDGAGRGQMGLGFKFSEMLPTLPNFYSTGKLILRKKVGGSQFL